MMGQIYIVGNPPSPFRHLFTQASLKVVEKAVRDAQRRQRREKQGGLTNVIGSRVDQV